MARSQSPGRPRGQRPARRLWEPRLQVELTSKARGDPSATDEFLGLLYVTEDYQIFGYLTCTRCGALGRNRPQPPQLRARPFDGNMEWQFAGPRSSWSWSLTRTWETRCGARSCSCTSSTPEPSARRSTIRAAASPAPTLQQPWRRR